VPRVGEVLRHAGSPDSLRRGAGGRAAAVAVVKERQLAYSESAMSSVARQIVVVTLLLATVIALFVAGQIGQRRLEQATARIEVGAQRQQALDDVWQLLRQAESSQRGYILLGNPDYLTPFQEAAPRLAGALQQLDAAFAAASPATRADVAQLAHLANAKFGEMRATVEQFATHGRTAALQMMRTDVGELTMTQIDDLVGKIQLFESSEALESSRRFQANRWVNYITTSAALITSAVLLLVLSRLTVRQLRAREEQAAQLAARQAELERLVDARTEELSELSNHLQSLAEQEKTALSRELHDELGGLLVATRMDVSWLEEHLRSPDPEVRGYFKRVQEALQSGVDIKRRVVENLRPTLLDNLGLVPALRWLVSEYRSRGEFRAIEHYPAEEDLQLTPQAAIAVFRIVQEALTNVLKHAHARTVEVALQVAQPWLVVRVVDDGVGLPPERLKALRSHGLAAMRQRARALGGQWHLHCPVEGGTQIEVRLPLERVLAREELADETSA
jgi:signal transduction histidine kinase